MFVLTLWRVNISIERNSVDGGDGTRISVLFIASVLIPRQKSPWPHEYYSSVGPADVLSALLSVLLIGTIADSCSYTPWLMGARHSGKEDPPSDRHWALAPCILVIFCMFTFILKRQAGRVVKSMDSWARLLWIQIPALQHPAHVILSKLHNLSVPLFLYLRKKGMVRIISSTSQLSL